MLYQSLETLRLIGVRISSLALANWSEPQSCSWLALTQEFHQDGFFKFRRIKKITRKIAEALELNGPFNIQFIAKGNAVKVIECNVRASRSFPFVSKILRVNFIELAARIMLGHPVPELGRRDGVGANGSLFDLDYVGVKAPQFSFTRLDGADPTLGVEMASTGEVSCPGDDFEEAFLKALLAVGYRLPVRTALLSTGSLQP